MLDIPRPAATKTDIEYPPSPSSSIVDQESPIIPLVHIDPTLFAAHCLIFAVSPRSCSPSYFHPRFIALSLSISLSSFGRSQSCPNSCLEPYHTPHHALYSSQALTLVVKNLCLHLLLHRFYNLLPIPDTSDVCHSRFMLQFVFYSPHSNCLLYENLLGHLYRLLSFNSQNHTYIHL